MSKKTKVKSNKKDNDFSIDGLSLTDPLDINGNEPNFLNNELYSDEYKELAKKWSVLPLYENKEQMENLFKSIANNQVTLVVSGTGSGKTVLVPKFLLKYFMVTGKGTENNCRVVVTNPKILTTIYNAEYGAKTLDVALGTSVGYKFRGSPETMYNKEMTKLLYSTDGLLLSQIFKGDTMLSEFQGIIIDEAHERQVPMDLLLYFIKNILKNRPEFKLIIMSATIDPTIYKNFYEKDGITFDNINVSGKSNFPIVSHYMAPNDKINFFTYMDVGISIILKLLEEDKQGDILMFITSQNEAEKGCARLRSLCTGSKQVKLTEQCGSYYCAEVYSKMSDENRELAIDKDKYKALDVNYKRKIIFATNVAESSITLDGIVYVIDSGLEIISYFNYAKYAQVIDKQFTTQAQIKQRMGRAGRTQDGICYHLYTEDKFKKLELFPKPAIVLANLNDQFLSFIKYQKYLSEAIKLGKNLITPITPYQLLSFIRYLHFYNLIKIVDLEKMNSQNGGYVLQGKQVKKLIRDTKYKNLFNDYSENDSDLDGGYSDSDSDTDSITDDEKNNELIKVEEGLTANSLTFKMIDYKNMNKDNSFDKFEGCLTRFGKIINEMSGYPMELCMLAFYGKLLSLPMMYGLVSVITAMDYKIENLIRFPPNIQNNEKINFINENFPDAIMYYYSEHLFVYNLLTNYYEMDNKRELLNITIFEKAIEIKATFSKILDRVRDTDMELINQKYKLIDEEKINVNSLELMEKIYLCIFLAYKYHTIKLIEEQNKPIYQVQNYIENTSNPISFNFGKQIEKGDANNYTFGICSGVTYAMGKVYLNGCTLIPNSVSSKFI